MGSQAALRAALDDGPELDLDLSELTAERSAWALEPEALRFLARLVLHLRPHHILEFGSGVSTRVLEWAADRCQTPCYISTLENDPKYACRAARWAGERVKVQFAPLVTRRCDDRQVPAFALRLSRLASSRPADLVLVDGPPSALGGREGALYQALDFSRPGTIVLLDDADRDQEQEALQHLRNALGDTIEINLLPGFPKGLAAITVLDPRAPGRPAVLGYLRTAEHAPSQRSGGTA